MTLKIETVSDRGKTIIRPCGRLQAEHVDELKKQLEGAPLRFALDLEGVTLVDVEVIRFLNRCETSGIQVLHCWPYIREWMSREQQQ